MTIYSQTQISNLTQPSKFEVVDVGTDGDYTRADGRVFRIVSTGAGGNITAVGAQDSSSVLFPSTVAASSLDGLFKEIKQTGTAPSDIVVGFFD